MGSRGEWGSVEVEELAAEQIQAMADSSAVTLKQLDVDRWQVTAKQFVGTVNFPGLALQIVPKIPVYKLMALLCESSDGISWFDHQVPYEVSDDLLQVMTDSFCLFAERVIAQGLLQDYQQIDDTLYGIRGRLRLADQIARHAGLAIPVEISYDEFTSNVLENQLLAGACRVLLLLKVGKRTRARLLNISKSFADIKPAAAEPVPPEPLWNRLNERYRHAVFLSRLVLSASSLEDTQAAKFAGASFLVDMNQLFEDVVGKAIKKTMEARHSGEVLLQHQENLDFEGNFRIRPDVLWRRGDRMCGVADIKYKLPATGDIAGGDVYQTLTYAMRYDLDNGMLIYAEAPKVSQINIEGVTLYFDWIDLASSPEERQRQADGICDRLAGL